MPLQICVTIDTEEDDWADYLCRDPKVTNILRLPALQEIFDEYHAIPTYLVTHSVVTNQSSREVILKLMENGNCEIGVHCHPWNTPPFMTSDRDSVSMMCNLTHEEIHMKMETLHNTIIKNLGVEPTTFRAGRYGFGPNVAQVLIELGYTTDTSVTPLVNWEPMGGPDFRKAPRKPYRFDPSDTLSERTRGALIEIPASIGFLQKRHELRARLFNRLLDPPFSKYHAIGMLDRLKILSRRWLTPEQYLGRDIVALAHALIGEGTSVLNMTFHSTSLLPGAGPAVRSEKELTVFLENLRHFFEFGKALSAKFVGLEKVAEGPIV